MQRSDVIKRRKTVRDMFMSYWEQTDLKSLSRPVPLQIIQSAKLCIKRGSFCPPGRKHFHAAAIIQTDARWFPSEMSAFNCISLVLKSEKDTVRLNSAHVQRTHRPSQREKETRSPRNRTAAPSHRSRRAETIRSSIYLLLLISIKFNPDRFAVGGTFTSCNSCLPLWPFCPWHAHALLKWPPESPTDSLRRRHKVLQNFD